MDGPHVPCLPLVLDTMPPWMRQPVAQSVVETGAESAAPVAAPEVDSEGAHGPDDPRRQEGRSPGPSGPDTDNGDPEGPPFSRTTRRLIAAGVVVVLLVCLVMRFWTVSDLWLDEALTVDISRLPLHEIPSFLKRDGAPPLYYVLLHFWMGWFGTSDVAVRALSGVFGVVTVPLAWFAGLRLGGRKAGWAAMLLVATSPFAIRYDTEARMYSLVVLLTVCGFLALDRSIHNPRAGNLVAVAAVTGLLLYTHYWSLYLVATVLIWLAWTAWRGRPAWRRGARASLVAAAVGCATFLPWVPIFLYQSAHTGHPVGHTGQLCRHGQRGGLLRRGQHQPGAGVGPRLLRPGRRRAVRGGHRPSAHRVGHPDPAAGRPLAVAVGGTLAAAVAGGFLSNSAFDARYASVVFIPLILLVALGLVTFRDRRVRGDHPDRCRPPRCGLLDSRRHHQPHPGWSGGGRSGRPGQARRRGGLLSRPAGPGGQPPATGGALRPDHLPPVHRAGIRQLGQLRGGGGGGVVSGLCPTARGPGRRRPPDLRGVGRWVPGL